MKCTNRAKHAGEQHVRREILNTPLDRLPMSALPESGHSLRLFFPKFISGRIGDAAQPRSEWRQWRQIVGRLDARGHLSVMPSACALDCNTSHRRKEFASGA